MFGREMVDIHRSLAKVSEGGWGSDLGLLVDMTPRLVTSLQECWDEHRKIEYFNHFSDFLSPSLPFPKLSLPKHRDMALGLKQSKLEPHRDLYVALNCPC